MKLYKLILIILATCVLSCKKERNKTIINGKITGVIVELIEYTIPLDGINFFGFEDSVQPDSLGTFQIELDIDKACFIEFSKGYESYGTLIVEPEMNYAITINIEKENSSFRVKSKNEKGQALYNQISNRSMIAGEGHFEIEAMKYNKDSVSAEIKKRIAKKQETELQGFEQLLQNNLISKDFYNLIEIDRSYFYKGAQGSVGFMNFLNSLRGNNNLSEKEYTILWREIFQSHPISNPNIMRSPWFYYYIENYLRYNEFIVDSMDIHKISEIGSKGLIHTHQVENAKQYLSGKNLEYYYAAYLYYSAINKTFEEELITLFEKFKKEYPNSKYTIFIEPEIIPMIAFHKKKTEPLNERIKFIENFDSINSLKEVIEKINGKQCYVDVWATWCSPCKVEFKYNEELYKLLKSKEFTMLYISIDDENREKQWREMISYYNLEGYHVRANKKLIADLKQLRGDDSFGIPWHILTDGRGNVTKKYVSGPSEIEMLRNQLD